MLGAGPMASLASDAIGQSCGEDVGLAERIAPKRDIRVGVVAEHALASDLSTEVAVLGGIEPWRHVPPVLGVPGHRQFPEFTRGCLMEVGSSMVSAADAEVGFEVDVIDDVARCIEFILFHPHAAVIIKTHAVMEVGQLMMKVATLGGEVGDGIGCSGGVKGLAHAQMSICCGNVFVAFCATGIIHVALGDQWDPCRLAWMFLPGEGNGFSLGNVHHRQRERQSQDEVFCVHWLNGSS